MFKKIFMILVLTPLAYLCANGNTLQEEFNSPSQKYRPYTLWWLNGKIDKATADYQIEKIKEDGFGGIVPLTILQRKPATDPLYLTEEWFNLYEHIFDKAKELGMQAMFYDDNDFPSGVAGYTMREKFPNSLLKWLWQGKAESTVGGVKILAPDGIMEAAMVFDPSTKTFRDVTKEVEYIDSPQSERKASPSQMGNARRSSEKNYMRKYIIWKGAGENLIFYAYVLATVPNTQITDYLDPNAVKNFMTLTYEKAAERFDNKGIWGRVVKSTFYDDLSMFYSINCATWSSSVSKRFEEKHSDSAAKYYPFLFVENHELDDIPDAGKMRALLFECRAELFSEAYPKTVEQWSQKRGITAAGHPSETYALEPLQFDCDPILFYKYSGSVLMDSIHRKNYAVKGAKIPTSAAVNYDKDIVYCEIYGNFSPPEHNDGLMLYRAAIDMFTRGCNSLIAHGTWLDEKKVSIQPEISWRNPKMAKDLAAYNTWAARMQCVLQGSANVSELLVYYPIKTLAAHYKFAPKAVVKMDDSNELPYADYMKIGMFLTDNLKRTFHFIHPEIFENKCTIENGKIILPNKLHYETYKAVILPKCEYMGLREMQKLLEFSESGGLVIATGVIPSKSADMDVPDSKISEISERIFKKTGNVLIESADAVSLAKALDSKGIKWDVLSSDSNLGQDMTCQHNRKDGRDFYIIGNASTEKGRAKFQIYGSGPWEIWNPHNGEISVKKPDAESEIFGGNYAMFEINLDAGTSVIISKKIN